MRLPLRDNGPSIAPTFIQGSSALADQRTYCCEQSATALMAESQGTAVLL